MIGRGAQGRPWIFAELNQSLYKNTGKQRLEKILLRDIMLDHLNELHRFYGEEKGVRVARKHLVWYCEHLADVDSFRYQAVRADSAQEQLRLIKEYFDRNEASVSLAA